MESVESLTAQLSELRGELKVFTDMCEDDVHTYKDLTDGYKEASQIARKWIERGSIAEKDRDLWKARAERYEKALNYIVFCNHTAALSGRCNACQELAKSALAPEETK